MRAMIYAESAKHYNVQHFVFILALINVSRILAKHLTAVYHEFWIKWNGIWPLGIEECIFQSTC